MDARTRILRAAVELLSERGCASVTISAVARASGLSRPTVYAHFGTREEVVAEALRITAAEVARRVVERAAGAPSAAEFVVAVTVALRGEFRRQPALRPLAFPPSGGPVVGADAIGSEALTLAREFLRPLLARHPELEPDLDEIAETLVRAFLSLVMFESERSASDARLRDYLHRRLVPALGIPPAPGR